MDILSNMNKSKEQIAYDLALYGYEDAKINLKEKEQLFLEAEKQMNCLNHSFIEIESSFCNNDIVKCTKCEFTDFKIREIK